MKTKITLAVAVLTAAGLAGVAVAEKAEKKKPSAAAAEVPYPKGYRSWTHVKSMVIQEGHALFDSFGGVHHIYANDKALEAMKKGKSYPKGSVFIFDLLEAKAEGGAIVEGDRKVLGVMHKDPKRFVATGGWGWEGFRGDTEERLVTDPVGACFGCHQTQKPTGYVFTTWRK